MLAGAEDVSNQFAVELVVAALPKLTRIKVSYKLRLRSRLVQQVTQLLLLLEQLVFKIQRAIFLACLF